MKHFWLYLYKLSAKKLQQPPAKRPSVADLKAMLNAEEGEAEVIVLPDGSITAV